MDVSSTSTSPTSPGLPVFREIRCDVCGYPRTGLPHSSLCPECGHTAPQVIEPVLQRQGAAMDRSEQAWLVSLLVGLGLLVFTSLVALRVALLMSIGGLVLTVINAPAPKLWTGVLLQRQIGNPGPWGVLGTLAVLGNVLAIWLITEPRPVASVDEPALSIRRLARWSCLLVCGGFIGALWGGSDISRWWAWDSMWPAVIAVGIVELVVNTLLYLHLSSLAKHVSGRGVSSRPYRLLRLSCWIIPALCAVGAAISMIRGLMQDEPVMPWRIAQIVYGAAALAAGMLATAGVLHLMGSVAAVTVDRSMVSLGDAIVRVPASLLIMFRAIQTHPKQWITAAGIALWLWNASPMLMLTTLIEHRMGFGGDLPTINFIGPKVWAVALLGRGGRYFYADEINNTSAFYTTIFAVWMMTAFRPSRTAQRVAPFVRWLPTTLIGIALGLAIAMSRTSELGGSRWTAAFMVAIEAPSTALLYAYLTLLATAMGCSVLARHLRCVTVVAIGSILAPIAFYALSKPLRGQMTSPLALGLSAMYGVITVTAGVFAWAVLARLIWALIAPTMHNHDRAHPSADPQ